MLLQLAVIGCIAAYYLPGCHGCADRNKFCRSWASTGQCRSNPAYMNVNCRMSCGLCGTNSGRCTDMNRSCGYWARTGQCTSNPGYMKIYCRKSCRLCGTGGGGGRGCSGCRDNRNECSSWASRGECSRNPRFMLQQCRFSCKQCSCGRPKPKTQPPVPPTQKPPKPTDYPSPPLPVTGDFKTPPLPPTEELPSPPLPTTPMKPPIPGTTVEPPVPPVPGTTVEPPVPPVPGTTVEPPVPPIPGTTTVAPVPPIPECKQSKAVGIAIGSFPSEAFKASTSESRWHQASQARLNNQPSSEGVGAWCAGKQDNNQYIAVDLGEQKNITAILSQGRDSEIPKYVMKYTVETSMDGTNWVSVADEAKSGNAKEFDGNSDNTSVKKNKLKEYVLARHIRIKPTDWENMICMRLEFEYCADNEV